MKFSLTHSFPPEIETGFPITQSVVSGRQQGSVYRYADNFLIVHKAGFCSVIQTADCTNQLIDIFLTSSFPTYFHIYDATEELIKCATDIPAKFGTKTRERIRLAYFKNSHKNSVETIDGFSTREMVREDLIKIDEFKLDLENRFWNGPADTLKNSLAQIVIDKDSRPVSICYAAAVENRIAEIDVFTSERYRGKGLAKLAVEAFVNNCVAKNIKPTWDCFEDNTASKKTALSLGFDKIQEYNFLSIYNIIK